MQTRQPIFNVNISSIPLKNTIANREVLKKTIEIAANGNILTKNFLLFEPSPSS